MSRKIWKHLDQRLCPEKSENISPRDYVQKNLKTSRPETISRKIWHLVSESLHSFWGQTDRLTDRLTSKDWQTDNPVYILPSFAGSKNMCCERKICCEKKFPWKSMCCEKNMYCEKKFAVKKTCAAKNKPHASATSRFWHIVSESLHSFWGLTDRLPDWQTDTRTTLFIYFPASREVKTLAVKKAFAVGKTFAAEKSICRQKHICRENKHLP